MACHPRGESRAADSGTGRSGLLRTSPGDPTDLHRERAYPSYLYFNPYAEAKNVAVELGDKPVDLYDTLSNRFLRRQVRGTCYVTLPSDTPMVLVLTPAGGELSVQGTKCLVDGVVIDYQKD